MALLPTLLAIGIGVALGLHWGGRLDNLIAWRPPWWQALGAGVSLLIVLDLVPIGVEGAIAGTALYEGRFTLEDALDLTWPERRGGRA